MEFSFSDSKQGSRLEFSSYVHLILNKQNFNTLFLVDGGIYKLEFKYEGFYARHKVAKSNLRIIFI